MATKTQLQVKKGDYLSKLIDSHDFGMVYETHGTKGKEGAYIAPTGCTAFWSHLSAQRAGIGILVRKEFLALFATTKDSDWEEIEPGRLARLRLRGPQGNLDLWAAYLTTGEDPKADYTARKHTRHLLHDRLAPNTSTLSIVAGDWNYATHNNDRWCCSRQTWTGDNNRTEADEANEQTFHPHHLHELYQENHTYFSTKATSRIDRVYTNHHLSEQLDHKFGCNTLTRPAELSTHAALSYYRQRPPQHNNNDNDSNTLPTIGNATINHPSWAKRVAAELNASSETNEDFLNPVRRLMLTKRAMHKVSHNMVQDHIFAEATSNDDRLNCTLSFIRAAQNVNLDKMYRKYLEYPHIGTYVNPNDPNTSNTQGFQKLQDHAVSLAKQHLTDELHETLQQTKEQPHDYRTTTRKNNILTHLKKLTPGNCNAIGALDLGNKEYATDPTQIAQQLATHWAKTFKHKHINKHLLREWLNTLPNLSSQQRTGTGPPQAHNDTRPATQQNTNKRTQQHSSHNEPTHQKRQRHDNSHTTRHLNDNLNIDHAKSLGPMGRTHKPRKPLPTQAGAWRVRRKDIETAIQHSGNSSPGPDGIPFKAWRALGPLGISILYDMATCLETDEAQQHLTNAFHDTEPSLGHQYNHSILVCLPKKSISTTDDGTKAYSLNNTRPLSIVNCDNRLIASAARNRWESHLTEWIRPRQQGFLSGRSILNNLIQLDTASMITSLTQPDGACILLDFASAFPSISQEFLFSTLQHIGLPHNALNLLHSLYSNSYCEVKQGATSCPGFALETGVRQGCPLSPLLYATVAEVLLDAIEHRCPKTLALCYADDTALVLDNFWKEAPILKKLLQEFAEVSGLHLNLGKCVIIPLDEGTLDTFQKRLDAKIPGWKKMQVAHHGKYLGFMVGPDKGDKSWQEPTRKFLERCQLWEAQGAGLHYHTTAYNTFALSTLTYIAQLEYPPPETLLAEKQGLTKVISGPHRWVEPEDLWRLKEHYGQSSSCKSLHHTTLAAQLRVRRWDPSCRHSHHQLNVEDLRTALHHARNDVNLLRWAPWYQRSFALKLENTTQQYIYNIGPIEELIPKPKQPLNREQQTKHHNDKKHFQRNAYNKLLQADTYNPTARNRGKFTRWELHIPDTHAVPLNTTCRQNTPAWQARRALASLQLLKELAPPRVCAAALSTLWNRWCTHRRYQHRHWKTNQCLLGCSTTNEDSIEHYYHCEVTQNTLRRQLNLPAQLFANLHSGLLCNANIRTIDQLTSIALLNYALYNTTNYLRQHPHTPKDLIPDMLSQKLREGAKHHPNATTVLDNRWNINRHSKPLPPIPYTI